jgi:hypothetical protein
LDAIMAHPNRLSTLLKYLETKREKKMMNGDCERGDEVPYPHTSGGPPDGLEMEAAPPGLSPSDVEIAPGPRGPGRPTSPSPQIQKFNCRESNNLNGASALTCGGNACPLQ